LVELTISDEQIKEIGNAVAKHQPELVVTAEEGYVSLEGRFVVSAPMGPYDFFDVRVGIFPSFPRAEPIVFETGDRIPKEVDRHIFPTNGDCCLGVWEEWLLTTPDQTFETFLTGAMHDYFVSQTYFEVKGKWPFGERPHGMAGVLESFAELLGVENDTVIIADHLRLLTRNTVKGHVRCPCGSGRKLRQCHRGKVEELKQRINPAMAKRMLDRVVSKNETGTA